MNISSLSRWVAIGLLVLWANSAMAHGIGEADATFVASVRGPAPGPFLYLGAKHMVTGYDHILFLVGVVFYLSTWRDVIVYVSLFSLGHSITLLGGVLLDFGLNSYLVDAVIGISVAYKAFDNLGGIEGLAGYRPDPKLIVFVFGLIHGLGLATKLESLRLNHEGLVANLLAFNAGVELGQIMALALVLALVAVLRRSFAPAALAVNWAIMTAGFVLFGYQLSGYFLGRIG